eukprot:SM000219S06699  [mRNA]  locus=s219:150814:153076:- [translate_table: standard]
MAAMAMPARYDGGRGSGGGGLTTGGEGAHGERQRGEEGLQQQREAGGGKVAAEYRLGVDVQDLHGIHLSGYALRPGADEGAFQAAWEAASAPARALPGFVYQDLCRQQEELTAKVGDEGASHPSPFQYMEYTLYDSLESAQAAASANDRPPLQGLQENARAWQGLYKIAIRVVKEEPRNDQLVLYNLFKVDSQSTANFVVAVSWPRRVEFQSSEKGFLSATVHRSVVPPDASYAVFNRADWASMDALVASEARMLGNFPVSPSERERPYSVKYYPGLYKLVRSFAEDGLLEGQG